MFTVGCLDSEVELDNTSLELNVALDLATRLALLGARDG